MSEHEAGKNSCTMCTKEDDENMVQCDVCDKWYHFICVGVGQDVEQREWKCKSCERFGEKSGSAQQQIQRENQMAKTSANSKPHDVISKQVRTNIKVTSVGSKCGSSRKHMELELKRLDEEKQAQMQHIKDKYAVLMAYESGDEENSDTSEIAIRSERTVQWASDSQNNLNNGHMRCNAAHTNMQSEIQREYVPAVEFPLRQCERSDVGHGVDNFIMQKREGVPTHLSFPPRQGASYAATSVPTQQQLRARQVLSPDLPIFNGKPEEWPCFISNYENSTRICGFSDDENLLRLQKAIKGKAYEYVGNRLMLPALVNDVISTLRLIFGRPEQIIDSLLTKLRASPGVNANKLETFVPLALQVKNVVATMEASGLFNHLNNPMLISEIIEKLPTQMRLSWASHIRTNPNHSLKTLGDWLYIIAEDANTVIRTLAFNASQVDPDRKKTQRVNSHELKKNSATNSPTCLLCKEVHFIHECEIFKGLSYDDKWDATRKYKLCRSCLKQHDPSYCRKREECGIDGCTAKHNKLLHHNKVNPTVVAVQHDKSSNVLFKIVPVTVYGKNASVDLYAFLDNGSGPTLIEKEVFKALHVTGIKSDLALKWTDGSIREEEDSFKVDLKISSRKNRNKKFQLRDVRTVSFLDLPQQTMIVESLAAKFQHLRGIPIESYHGVIPKMIIGLNNISVARPLKFREGKPNEPAAAKTRLGWTIFGTFDNDSKNQDTHAIIEANLHLHICECDDDISLNKLMIENMNLESYNHEQQNDNHEFKDTIKRDGNRFVAKLLWKSDDITLPNNYQMALRRLFSFERKLEKDDLLRQQVNTHIHDMEKKGYIRKLSKTEANAEYARKWYLPIFAVRNPNKPKKTRVVWDAAAECNGISLNMCLNKGPDLLTPLVKVLSNFRIGKIGLCGDISEMYHRVSVISEDQQSQRFLWRDTERNRPPEHYVLQVLSFGATCSPAIAQMAKNNNALEYMSEFPRAAKSILERHYVDDLMDSVNTIDEAIQLAKDVRELHSRGNFHIHNWISNSTEVTNSLGEKVQDMQFCRSGITVDQVVEPEKVLGLWWNTNSDSFTFSLKFTKACKEVLEKERLPTKREVLRLVMSVFDPLGFLNHFTIHMRILLQQIWRSGIDWDDQISEEFRHEWFRWLALLSHVHETNIPRCYFKVPTSDSCKVELHVFMDASENAYAAIAYLRILYDEGIEVSLVRAKAKVAPLRPVSIPRMELLAAVMGARLGYAIVQDHDFKIDSAHFWVDSQTVLAWIHADPRNYKQFVMLRIGDIQQLTDVKNWHYVPSKLNVADFATKWSTTPSFHPGSKWFKGPDFLYTKEINIHNKDGIQHVALHSELSSEIIDIKRVSKWERLLRILAYVKRFITYTKLRRHENDKKLADPLLTSVRAPTSEELKWAENVLYKVSQVDKYGWEIRQLARNTNFNFSNSSSLKNLMPFIDENGVVRSKTRIQNTTLVTELVKNPVVLPKDHYVTYLLVEYYHRRFRHVNHETVINEIFQRYRIHGLRNLVRKISRNCSYCKINRAKPVAPQMGPLPVARMSAFQKPFSFTGIDYFGPITVTVGRRSDKRYGVLFTCLTCRAIHLEVAFSLDTSSCVMAIRNFVARRGTPIEFFSDNGTNLKASERILREAYQKVDNSELQAKFTTCDTKWTFIPPGSPHMGGAWERLVRSVKATMYKIITPATRLNDEKLNNLFAEVESIVNSRPLTYLSLDTAEQEALTPNHFLLGSSSGIKPPGKFDDRDQFVKESWRHSQYLADAFWRRWVAEILPMLTRQSKWFQKVKPIKVGDIAIVIDSNLPRYQWPKGIVTKVIAGNDGQVRSAFVRTSTGEYHRPAVKIAVLHINNEDDDDGNPVKVFPLHDRDTGGENVTDSAISTV